MLCVKRLDTCESLVRVLVYNKRADSQPHPLFHVSQKNCPIPYFGSRLYLIDIGVLYKGSVADFTTFFDNSNLCKMIRKAWDTLCRMCRQLELQMCSIIAY